MLRAAAQVAPPNAGRARRRSRGRSPKGRGLWGGGAVDGNGEPVPPPAIHPVRHGRVVDGEALDAVLEPLLRRARSRGFPPALRTRAALLVPPGLDDEEQLRFKEIGLRHGLGTMRLVDAVMAAARGAGLALNEPGGQMVIDIGGGKVCVAAVSMGGVVSWHWSEFGGEALDLALMEHMETRYQVRVSQREAERVKTELGSVYPLKEPGRIEAVGIQTRSGLEQKVGLDDGELRDVLVDACEPLVQAIEHGFKAVPPEVASDISRAGVALVGGGALLRGLPKFLEERTGLPFRVAPEPLDALIRGGQALGLRGAVPQPAPAPAGGE